MVEKAFSHVNPAGIDIIIVCCVVSKANKPSVSGHSVFWILLSRLKINLDMPKNRFGLAV